MDLCCLQIILRLESIKSVLPNGCWPAGSKSSGVVGPFKPLGRLGGVVFPQYKMEHLYCCDSVTLLSELGLEPDMTTLSPNRINILQFTEFKSYLLFRMYTLWLKWQPQQTEQYSTHYT
jgi:hypothetical protein